MVFVRFEKCDFIIALQRCKDGHEMRISASEPLLALLPLSLLITSRLDELADELLMSCFCVMSSFEEAALMLNY